MSDRSTTGQTVLMPAPLPAPRTAVRAAVRAAVLVMAAAVVASCGADDGGGEVRSVPAEYATIQAAVDAARSGDVVLIAPGVYRESVNVERSGVTIRGEDRNAVVLEGDHQLVNGISVTADGVAVENLTIRHYRQNGLIFNGAGGQDEAAAGSVYGAGDAVLAGYRAAYVTASGNGLYGIYAFASRGGLITHSYTSGHPDSGIYVGQCKPCDVVVTDSVAENNAIGYYGTNASGNVFVVNSVFRGNRLGVTPNSQEMELLAPQVETVVAGNLVLDNDNPDAPAIPRGFFAGGIAIGGGTKNAVLRNRVSGHDGFGIGLVMLNEFEPIGNVVDGNVVTGNALDLYYESRIGATATLDNCFTGNTFESSSPEDVEVSMACGVKTLGAAPARAVLPVAPPDVDYRQIPDPGPQTTMPGDVRALPASPATTPAFPELDRIEVPAS